MVCVIALILLGGVLGVGHIRGWFDKEEEDRALLTELRGVIRMEREGVSYPVERDTLLRAEDQISCDPGATAVICVGGSSLTLGEKAELTILDPSAQTFSAEVMQGEVFVNASNAVTLSFDGKTVALAEAVASLSVRRGAQSIGVLEGRVEQASAGQLLSWVGETLSVEELSIRSLNDFTIACIREANEEKSLCFSNADLDQLMAERQAALQALLEQQRPITETTQESSENTASTETSEVTGPVETTAQSTQPSTQPMGNPLPTESSTETEPPETQEPTEETEPFSTEPSTTEASEEPQPSTETEPPTEPEPPTEAQPALTCTITIRCDTILNNMDLLDPSKAGFVPADGVILYPVTVGFEEGETVFDVLKRICETTGIQLEYSWTPLYDSYYIEGINHLYEFDCGSESGWMYKVNGWFPNYGCSSYYLEDGDLIEWCYTCTGLGADVGAPGW